MMEEAINIDMGPFYTFAQLNHVMRLTDLHDWREFIYTLCILIEFLYYIQFT